ncbi:MAG: Crp/Fnr family transcriptional regulator [Actinomycetota bacterium]|jgi:CRP-like cAMP-binding protein|nr:Crp/Fnr family transcriptional regulator [Actinomycetota bacterium]
MTPPSTDAPREVLAALRECRLWRTASDEAVAGLASVARLERVKRGMLLGSEGDPAERFGVVVSGKVLVYYLGADGRRIIFENLGAGDPFGTIAALSGGRLPATIEAATDGQIVWLGREDLFTMLANEPIVARSLIADLANKVVNFTAVVQTLSMDVPARLARFLFQRSLSVGETTSEGLVVELGMPKSDLASALGTVPETLSRAFGKLRDDEILEVRGSRVVIFEVGALARLGSGYEE